MEKTLCLIICIQWHLSHDMIDSLPQDEVNNLMEYHPSPTTDQNQLNLETAAGSMIWLKHSRQLRFGEFTPESSAFLRVKFF